AMAGIAYGDLASAILALIAVVFLRYRWRGAVGIAWLVNAVTSLDWLYAGFLAASSQLVTYGVGGNWYIINYDVTVICVINIMVSSGLSDSHKLKQNHALGEGHSIGSEKSHPS